MHGTDLDDDVVQEKYAKLVDDVGPSIEAIYQRIPALLHKRDTHQHKYIGLLKLVTEAARIVAPYTPCQKGCSHCCNMAVSVPEYEAKRIAAHIGKPYVQQGDRHAEEVRRMSESICQGADPDELLKRLKEREVMKFLRVPCVFLGKDGACTIYPVRPLACRTYHTIAPTNEPCKLGMAGERAKEVPAVNFNNFHMAHAMLSPLDGAVADIREWFPEGRGK